MRILLLADVHGNRAALEAITEPHDICLVLGDLVDYGPEPGACVDWVRRHAHVAVRGNHDHGVAQDVEVQGVGGFRFLTACTRPFSVSALTPVQRRYLADLPTSKIVNIEDKRFLLVHATPRDPMDEYAHPDPAFWAPRLTGLDVDYVCVGHTHQQYTLGVGTTTVINPGSVGLPRDGDPRAGYGIMTIDESGVSIGLKRIDYPAEETVQALMATDIDESAKRTLAELYRGGPGANHLNRVTSLPTLAAS